MKTKLSKRDMLRRLKTILHDDTHKELLKDMHTKRWKTKDVRDIFEAAEKAQAKAIIRSLIRNQKKVKK